MSFKKVNWFKEDKVIEDKIAELENIINHKLGGWDKHGITYQEILYMKSENDKLKQKISDLESLMQKQDEFLEMKNIQIAELKQRIAELENENKNLNIRIFLNEAYGDKKPTKINLNDRVRVKLTPLGAEIYHHQFDDVDKKIKENGGTGFEPMMPQIDKDGYTEIQLWHFMELYGEHIGMCKPNVIKPLDIVIAE